MSARDVLAIYVEPTPYTCGLLNELMKAWPGTLEARFIGFDRSQMWSRDATPMGLADKPVPPAITPKELWKSIGDLKGNAILHLCGWGHPLLLLAMGLAKARGLRMTIESDSNLIVRPSRYRESIRRLTHPLLLRVPDHFLPGGTSQMHYLESYGVAPHRMTMSRMTVDVDAMQSFSNERGPRARQEIRQRHSIPENDLVVLFVGRLEPYKGILDLLEAFALVKSARKNVHLLIVGDGSLSATVRERSHEVSNVIMTGRLSGEQLWSHYAAADIFVLPSTFEPWGLVVNEAMAFGLPAVISDVAGCRQDLLPDGAEGEVFTAGQVQSLAEALDNLINDPDRRLACARAARARIAPWTLRNSARAITAAWEALV